jgi:hypothetical protein
LLLDAGHGSGRVGALAGPFLWKRERVISLPQ